MEQCTVLGWIMIFASLCHNTTLHHLCTLHIKHNNQQSTCWFSWISRTWCQQNHRMSVFNYGPCRSRCPCLYSTCSVCGSNNLSGHWTRCILPWFIMVDLDTDSMSSLQCYYTDLPVFLLGCTCCPTTSWFVLHRWILLVSLKRVAENFWRNSKHLGHSSPGPRLQLAYSNYTISIAHVMSMKYFWLYKLLHVDIPLP